MSTIPQWARALAIALLIGFLSSCTNPPKQNTPVGTIHGNSVGLEDVWRVMDIGRKVVPPAPTSNIVYTDDSNFDIKLASSMRGKVSPITVTMDSLVYTDKLEQGSQRLQAWLYAVSRNGRVQACPDTTEQSAGAIILVLILKALPIIDDWLTYSWAKNYDAIVFVDKSSGKEIKSIVFTRRTDSPSATNSQCKNLEIAKPSN